jgi:hypothetical protein
LLVFSSVFVFAPVFLVVIPEGDLLLPLLYLPSLPSHFVTVSEATNRSAFAFAFLVVIPEGDLLLPLFSFAKLSLLDRSCSRVAA